MAQMYPSRVPDYIMENPLRESEVDVYNRLSQQLDSSFHVFYSSPWLGTTPDGAEIDGEADFVIAHAQLGILVVEVKGGRIAVSDDTREWRSTDRHGIMHRIKNPVAQARAGKYALLEKLKQSAEWRPRYINARHGVVLSHTKRPGYDLGADMPLRIFAFEDDMDHLGEWVKSRLERGSRYDASSPVEALGPEGINALRALLSGGFTLRFSIGRALQQDAADIMRLTEEQIHILRDLDENRCVAIAGPVGSGKTVLALHKAMDCAKAGQETLLVCYNKGLRAHLSRTAGELLRVAVHTFHELCVQLAREAGLPAFRSQGEGQEFFDKTLPDLMLESLARLPDRRFDAVIVDEGQDFDDAWLECIECTLRSKDKSLLYVFYDNNQRVIRRGGAFIAALPAARYRLSRNFRNTRRIFGLVRHFYAGDPVKAVGPAGQEISFHAYGRFSDIEVLKQQLGLIIAQDRVPPDQVAVLVADAETRDRVCPGGRIGRYLVTDAAFPAKERVTVDTVRRFKGLDRPVVIVFRPEDFLDDVEMLYTSLSRAMLKLVVVASSSALDFLKAKTGETSRQVAP